MELQLNRKERTDKSTIGAGGRRSRAHVSTQRIGNTLQAQVTCVCDSLAIYHVFKDMDTTLRLSTTQTQLHAVEVPARLTWWQQFKVDYGGYAMAVLLLYLLLKIGWWALRTYTSIQLPASNIISKFL